MVINTPTRGKISTRDGFIIRREAVERKIGVITALDTLKAIIHIKKWQLGNESADIYSIYDTDN